MKTLRTPGPVLVTLSRADDELDRRNAERGRLTVPHVHTSRRAIDDPCGRIVVLEADAGYVPPVLRTPCNVSH